MVLETQDDRIKYYAQRGRIYITLAQYSESPAKDVEKYYNDAADAYVNIVREDKEQPVWWNPALSPLVENARAMLDVIYAGTDRIQKTQPHSLAVA
jgi:hypothetical protein